MSTNDASAGRWGQPFRQTPEQWREVMDLYAKQLEGIQNREKLRASDTGRAMEQEHAQPGSPREFNAVVTEDRRLKDVEHRAGRDLSDAGRLDGKSVCPGAFWVVDDEEELMETLCMRPGGHSGEHGDYGPDDDTLVKNQALSARDEALDRFNSRKGGAYDAAQVVQSLMCKDTSLDPVFGCPLRRGHLGPHEIIPAPCSMMTMRFS